MTVWKNSQSLSLGPNPNKPLSPSTRKIALIQQKTEQSFPITSLPCITLLWTCHLRPIPQNPRQN